MARWVETGVNPQCRGEALLSRYADDLGCACRFRSEAARLYQALPKRLGTFTLEVAPEKPRLLRFRRVHAGMTRRCTCLGCEGFGKEDRQGVPRVKRRTARKTLPRACQRIKDWIPANRHVPGNAFFRGLKARLRGHYNYDGGQGNSHARHRVFDWAMTGACKGLHRRGGKRRSFSWQRFTRLLDAVPIERPRLTELSRRRVYA